jgi:IS30 family transposase
MALRIALTNKDFSNIKRLRKQNKSYNEIAKKYSISSTTVRRIISEHPRYLTQKSTTGSNLNLSNSNIEISDNLNNILIEKGLKPTNILKITTVDNVGEIRIHITLSASKIEV